MVINEQIHQSWWLSPNKHTSPGYSQTHQLIKAFASRTWLSPNTPILMVINKQTHQSWLFSNTPITLGRRFAHLIIPKYTKLVAVQTPWSREGGVVHKHVVHILRKQCVDGMLHCLYTYTWPQTLSPHPAHALCGWMLHCPYIITYNICGIYTGQGYTGQEYHHIYGVWCIYMYVYTVLANPRCFPACK